jgi:hypothetical protein
MSKLARFRSRHGEPKRNPPLATDVAEYLIPGFAAFALDRLVTRVAAAQIAKRWPKLTKHAGAIAAVGTFGAAWYGAHRVKYLEKYHHPIVIGAGLAALQAIAQIYFPKLSALIGDPCPTPAPVKQVAAPQAPLIAAPAPAPVVPAGFKPTTANDWYTYNDAYDAGGYKGKVEVPTSQTNPAPAPDPEEAQLAELLDNSDLQLDNSDMGLLS